MSSLFRENCQEWNEDVVKDLFIKHDANLILEISLSTAAEDDRLFWGKERDGLYLVKSAYRLCHLINHGVNDYDDGI